jgi:hypothetical protein
MEWELIDAQQRAAEHPDTFKVPSAAELGKITAGSVVKIGVEFSPLSNGCNGERFWVRARRVGDTILHGVVLDDLVFHLDNLGIGSYVNFERRNVMAIWTDLPEGEVEMRAPCGPRAAS